MRLPVRKKILKNEDGFTLIELLLVIVIIATLAVGVFVALNPTKRLQDSKNARRTTDVDTILSAVHSYVIDNGGALPGGISAPLSQIQIGTATTGCAISNTNCTIASTTCYDLEADLPTYLKTMPLDPSVADGTATGYSIEVDANNMVTITACLSEGGSVIEASR